MYSFFGIKNECIKGLVFGPVKINKGNYLRIYDLSLISLRDSIPHLIIFVTTPPPSVLSAGEP